MVQNSNPLIKEQKEYRHHPVYMRRAAINAYGTKLYSITKLKMEGNQDTYQLGLLENGNMRTVWMNPELTASAGNR